jgi:hypothetical protein
MTEQVYMYYLTSTLGMTGNVNIGTRPQVSGIRLELPLRVTIPTASGNFKF